MVALEEDIIQHTRKMVIIGMILTIALFGKFLKKVFKVAALTCSSIKEEMVDLHNLLKIC